MGSEQCKYDHLVGKKIIAKIRMENDLSDAGMGVEICAEKGETLVVRHITRYGNIAVSHESVTDRCFIVYDGEFDLVEEPGAPEPGAAGGV